MQRLHIGDKHSRVTPGGSELHRLPGAIENFIHESSPHHHSQLHRSNENYKVYERSNIIAASKFATPRPIDQLSSFSATTHQHKDGHSNGSSTSSPQHLYEPTIRNHFIYEHVTNNQKHSPVYENLDFYSSGTRFDSANKRAQPQQAASQSASCTSNSRSHY